MKKLLSLLFLLFAITGYSQDFLKNYGTSVEELGYDLIKTSDNNILIAGTVRDTVSNTFDAYLMKLDTNGIVLWSKTYGGTSGNEGFNSVIEDNGNFYVCGYAQSYSSDTTSDVFLVQTDLSGTMNWSKTYGGTACAGAYCGDIGSKIIKEATNSYIIAGRYAGVSTNLMAGYILRVDNGGNMINDYVVDAVGSEWFTNIALAQNGDLLVVGTNKLGNWEPWLYRTQANGTPVFNNGYGDVTSPKGGKAVLEYMNEIYYLGDNGINIGLTKLNAAGDVLLVKDYGVTDGATAKDLLLSSDNNLYILGAIGNSSVLMKTDLNGDTIWVNYYLNLASGTNKLLEINNHVYTLGNTSAFGNGMTDMYLMKVSSDGNSENCYDWLSGTFYTNTSSVTVSTFGENSYNLTTTTTVNPPIISANLTSCQPCIMADFDFSVADNVVTFSNLTTPNVSCNWNFDDTNSSNTDDPINTYSVYGSYNVCLVAYDNCSSDTLCQTVEVIDYTSIDEINKSIVTIYPNPANQSIQLNGLDKIATVESIFIEDVSGKMVEIYDLNSTNIDVSKFSNGIYFLKILHGKGLEVVKFLKQ